MVYGCEGGECEGRWFMGVRVESVRVDGLWV